MMKGSVNWGQEAIDTVVNAVQQMPEVPEVRDALASLGLTLKPTEGVKCLATVGQDCVVWLTGN